MIRKKHFISPSNVNNHLFLSFKKMAIESFVYIQPNESPEEIHTIRIPWGFNICNKKIRQYTRIPTGFNNCNE